MYSDFVSFGRVVMQTILIFTLVLHILSGLFWAGTTFALAGAYQADQFFRPQMGAAVIVVATGGLLWYLVHPGRFGITEQILAVGVFSAFVAAGVPGHIGRTGPAKALPCGRIRSVKIAPSRCNRPARRRSFFDDCGHVHGGGTLCLTQTAVMSKIAPRIE
jgi:hypothetical protein